MEYKLEDASQAQSLGVGEDERKSPALESVSSDTKRSKPRVPSALTVENLRKHEEETDAIDVVELMTKNVPQGNIQQEVTTTKDGVLDKQVEHNKAENPLSSAGRHCSAQDAEEPLEYPPEDRSATPIGEKIARKKDEATNLLSDIWSQPRKQVVEPIPSPAVREEVRGLKFTGEEYLAISVDVQTDESWINETFEWPQSNLDQDLEPFASRPALGVAATDGMRTYSTESKRHRKQITSDISTAEISDDESVLPRELMQSGEKKRDRSSMGESDTEEENPVTELSGSEFEGSEALTQSTHGTARTLPSVGPPFILQYKPESQMAQIDYKEIDVSIPEHLNWDEMNSEQRDYYKAIMEDMKKIRMEKMATLIPDNKLISIEPHSAYGSRQERKLAKERERERSRMREMEKQSRQAAGAGGQMMANQTNFYAFARQLKTVNYSLSSEKCMEEGWTIRPVTPPTPEEPATEIFVYDPNEDIVSGKKYHHMFVRKLYPNGSIFLTVFPDGSGNVWYPSGNVAFSIIAGEKVGKLTFVVHEDIHPTEGHNIQAVFEPTGYCTCYYPSGIIRLLLTPFGGEYFSPHGERLKKWIWKDTQTHVHAPPFQPITFALSRKVGIRIMSQESVYITYTDGSRSVRFNAGTRLRLKPSTLLPKIQQVDADQILLEEKRINVQSIIERIQNNIKFPNSPRLKKIQLPNYLTAQLGRNAKLRERLIEQQTTESTKPKLKKKGANLRNNSSSVTTTSTKKNIPEIRKTKGRPKYPKRREYKENSEFQPVVIVN